MRDLPESDQFVGIDPVLKTGEATAETTNVVQFLLIAQEGSRRREQTEPGCQRADLLKVARIDCGIDLVHQAAVVVIHGGRIPVGCGAAERPRQAALRGVARGVVSTVAMAGGGGWGHAGVDGKTTSQSAAMESAYGRSA